LPDRGEGKAPPCDRSSADQVIHLVSKGVPPRSRASCRSEAAIGLPAIRRESTGGFHRRRKQDPGSETLPCERAIPGVDVILPPIECGRIPREAIRLRAQEARSRGAMACRPMSLVEGGIPHAITSGGRRPPGSHPPGGNLPNGPTAAILRDLPTPSFVAYQSPRYSDLGLSPETRRSIAQINDIISYPDSQAPAFISNSISYPDSQAPAFINDVISFPDRQGPAISR
jgi:hypothetical protein